MPSVSIPAKDNAQYGSLFFRPWAPLQGGIMVPNLALLGLQRKRMLEVYTSSAEATARNARTAAGHEKAIQEHVTWDATWHEYVRKGVVSESAVSFSTHG